MRLPVIILFLISSAVANAQQSISRALHISGHAYNSESPDSRLDDLMILNMRTSQGSFGKADGTFNINIERDDTILVASTGYEFRKFCWKDSLNKDVFSIEIPLKKLKVQLNEIVIFSPRDLESIYHDVEKLGYNKHDFEISGVNAMESPITFLYQEFSRLEQLKRHNAERINEVKRRNLLKELLGNYAAHDMINLDNNEFDDFIDFANVPESFMKNSTQYDFCLYIKRKYELYRVVQHRN